MVIKDSQAQLDAYKVKSLATEQSLRQARDDAQYLVTESKHRPPPIRRWWSRYCPICDKKVTRQKIELSDAYITRYDCSGIDCVYAYAEERWDLTPN